MKSANCAKISKNCPTEEGHGDMKKRCVVCGSTRLAKIRKHKSIPRCSKHADFTVRLTCACGRVRYTNNKKDLKNYQCRECYLKRTGNQIVEQSHDKLVITGKKIPRLTTLDELIEITKTDLKVWEVERHKLNKWEVGAKDEETGQIIVEPLFQVVAWLRKKKSLLHAEQIRKYVIDEIEKCAFQYPSRPKPPKVDPQQLHMFEPGICDVHLGALAWGEETGEDYDLKLGCKSVHWAVPNLIQKASGYFISKILLPLGNDFFHFDSPKNETARGTQVDVDTRWLKMFQTGITLSIWMIDSLLEAAPVDVLIIPDNHAPTTTLSLGEVLKAWYSKCPDVNIDNSPKQRKYHAYGVNLIGFGHGRDPKLKDWPLLMPVEVPEMWAKSKIREWHVAHWHQRKRIETLKETNGIILRVLPSLAGTDLYHYEHGYVGNLRSAEGYLWNQVSGLAGVVMSNLLEMPKGER